MTAYYNEHDPFAAAWLRQLIEYGHIAPGIVDERSIEDVTPADLGGFTQCHFFAGIGVWSYALRLAGWPDDRPIWTASCPCQPFSAAGKGGGFDDERHLWPALYWHISQCKPEIVIGEQVASKDGLDWWELVSSDLEIAGYANAALDFCAASVGAPHIRQRLYWMAYAAESGRFTRRRSGGAGDGRGSPWVESGRLRDAVRLDDTVGARLEGFGSGHSSEIGRNGTSGPVAETGEFGGMAYATGGRRGIERRPIEQGNIRHADGGDNASGGMAITERVGRPGIFGESGSGMDRGNDGERPQSGFGPSGENGGMAHADGRDTGTEGLQRSGKQRQQPEDGRHGQVDDVGRTSPTNGFWRNADWVFCRDGKWRPVEPGTFPLAHGTAARVGRLRGYGNAIVAPQAATFIQTVMEIL